MAVFLKNKVACLMMIIMITLMDMNAADADSVTCKQVATSLSSCLDYVKNGGSAGPPKSCCTGMVSLKAATKTSVDRQTACKCLKTSLANVKLDAHVLATLPRSCGVNLPYTITPSIDCTTVN